MLEILHTNSNSLSQKVFLSRLPALLSNYSETDKEEKRFRLLEDNFPEGELSFFKISVDYCDEEGLPPHETWFVRLKPSPVFDISERPLHWSFHTFCEAFAKCSTLNELKQYSIEAYYKYPPV